MRWFAARCRRSGAVIRTVSACCAPGRFAGTPALRGVLFGEGVSVIQFPSCENKAELAAEIGTGGGSMVRAMPSAEAMIGREAPTGFP